MLKTWKLLVFPGGTEIGLEINAALRDCKEVELYSAGAAESNHASFVFKNHDVVRSVTHKGWIEELNRVIIDRKIDFVFPAHDDVVLALSRERENINVPILSSPLETCEIARSKRATYRHLASHIATPIVYQDPQQVPGYPVFVKPDCGQGSKNAYKINSQRELLAALDAHPDLIILEYLPGEEYTVDCFSDRDRGILFCSARKRDRVRSGISVSSHVVEDPAFGRIAEKISSRMVFYGAWFFQLKRSGAGELVLLEVAPRIAGAMALSRVAGVNLPLLTLFEALRYRVKILKNRMTVQLDRAFINRYAGNITPKHIYIDLDDTLILKGKVNLSIVRFIFQSINSGACLYLITRHTSDVNRTLAQHRLVGVFDRIIHLKNGEPKSTAIEFRSDAIFIDDSFSERLEVSETTGIATFDNSMIELLQDYRV